MAYANGAQDTPPAPTPAPDPQPTTLTRGGGTSTIWPQDGTR